jgi:hypothetical protein
VVMRGAQNVFEDSSRALDIIRQHGNVAAGPGALLDRIPATPARALRGHIDSLKGNIGIDSLLKIKESGAGLGAIPQAQLEMLASLLGNLDTAQDPADLMFNLERVRETYEDIVRREGGDPQQLYADRVSRFGQGQAAPQPSAATPAPPQTGEVVDGFRFRGGDPADPNSWERVQ